MNKKKKKQKNKVTIKKWIHQCIHTLLNKKKKNYERKKNKTYIETCCLKDGVYKTNNLKKILVKKNPISIFP